MQPDDYFPWLAPENTVYQNNKESSGEMGTSVTQELSYGAPLEGKTNSMRCFYKTRLNWIDKSSE